MAFSNTSVNIFRPLFNSWSVITNGGKKRITLPLIPADNNNKPFSFAVLIILAVNALSG